MEDPSYSEREDAEDGAASQETTPAPARRAVLVKPRALPPPNPPDHGGGRCGRTRRSRSTLTAFCASVSSGHVELEAVAVGRAGPPQLSGGPQHSWRL